MSITTRLSNTIEMLKPYAGGAVIGAGVITAIGFGAGWVVTSGTLHAEVNNARVDALAAVCADNAIKHWKQEGKKLASLEGWNNDKRTNLAKQFALSPADWKLESEVRDHCGELIREAIEKN